MCRLRRAPLGAWSGLGGAGSLISRVLLAREMTDPQACAAYVNPRLSALHDPALLPDIDVAADRILGAMSRGERVAIYGDYDVDGVTATTILYRTLMALFPNGHADRVVTYIPHRIDEGYGLNVDAIEELAGAGCRVVVSVDCGVSAHGPAQRARELGVDLIITDHHNPPASAADLPPAFAVVHPRRPASVYPFGDLCGAGVAYKLAWRLCAKHSGVTEAGGRLPADLRTLLVDLLAFAALGVIADVVPLVDENRVLARFGLERVKHSPFIGLRALVEASCLAGEEVDSSAVGFKLAPRLNAAGRLGHARDALELFTTSDPARAAELAALLSRQNRERQAVEKHISDQAAEMAVAAGMDRPDRRAIVLAHPDWHAGVVGIACSRLVEQFCRPVILMQQTGEDCHGSARSIEGFNLHEAIGECRELLTSFGGHDMAAGLRLPADRLGAFVDRFTSIANERVSDEMLRPSLLVDADASLGELTLGAVKELSALAPFGRGNPEPRVRLAGVRLAESPRSMGAHAKHVSLTLRAEGARGTGDSALVRVVGWNWSKHLEAAGDPLRAGTPLEVVVKPRISTWLGRERVECELCDLVVPAMV
ncbi:MAG TPA: single-stranded-DNA-specific exonuclease RecJ [Phycisphaerales bacterium]|nr:single-stranded-DNA-specific exonuclease RecJ [Phycisphaerales bacterium]